MAKKKTRVDVEGPSVGRGSLGDALKRAGFDASAEPDESPRSEMPPPVSSAPVDLRKVTIHRDRKGRRGKTVTVIGGLELSDAELESVARQMRKSLGCGAHIEDRRIVLQGELVDRVREWVSKRLSD